MPFAILFNLVVFVFIAGMWILFIINIIRASKKNNSRNKGSRTTRAGQTVTRTERQPLRNERTQKKGNIRIQTLLRQNPAELYRTLKEQLPDQYKDELQEIFNAPNPAAELVRFLRRPDVWPFIQNLLRQETRPSSERKMRPLADRTRSTTIAQDQTSLEDDVEEISAATEMIENEQASLVEEYDSFSHYFDEMLADVPSGNSTPILQRTERNAGEQRQTKVSQQWLKDAIVASVILERPDF